MIWIVIFVSILIFIPFYYQLGREWYAPYSLFYIPFLACYIIAALNSKNWSFELGNMTALILLLGEISFLFGCFFASKIGIVKRRKYKKKHLFILKSKDCNINNSRLLFIVSLETILFLLYLIMMYIWGIRHGSSIIESINRIMLNSKFDGDGDPLGLPTVLQIFLQLNYIGGYFFAYLIARKVLLKEKTNGILLAIGYIVAILTNFLGGSRGPILEMLSAILLSFGIVYFYKTGRKSFSFLQIMKVLLLLIIVGVGFFEILPLMGRSQTAANQSDVFTQYIGSQVYNLNYYVENINKHSTFFCASTLSSLYRDIETFFKVDIGYKDGLVSNFFVFTNNGHNMGNVFSTYLSFYQDAGLFGVFLFSLIVGWFSEKYFMNTKINREMVHSFDYRLVIYIYIGAQIIFSFFSNRFFQNVVQLKMIIKIFWVLFMYLYLIEGSYLSFNVGHQVRLSLFKRKRVSK